MSPAPFARGTLREMKIVRSIAVASLVGLAIVACSGGGGGSVSDDDGGASSAEGGGGTCTSGAPTKACDATPCGGDIVGTWKLVTFCGPKCVTSLAQTTTYGAGGVYNGSGTWKYGPNNTVITTVGTASATGSYCVQGDTLWINRGTNCGPNDPGSIRSQWQRDCGGTTTTPDGGR